MTNNDFFNLIFNNACIRHALIKFYNEFTDTHLIETYYSKTSLNINYCVKKLTDAGISN